MSRGRVLRPGRHAANRGPLCCCRRSGGQQDIVARVVEGIGEVPEGQGRQPVVLALGRVLLATDEAGGVPQHLRHRLGGGHGYYTWRRERRLVTRVADSVLPATPSAAFTLSAPPSQQVHRSAGTPRRKLLRLRQVPRYPDVLKRRPDGLPVCYVGHGCSTAAGR